MTSSVHLSLLLAVDLGTLSSILILFLFSASSLGVQKLFRKVLKSSSVFILLEVLRIGGAVLEGLSEKLALSCVEEVAGREDDLELEVEVSIGHGILVEGHAELLDSLELLVLEDLSGRSGDEVFLSVEVVDGGGDSSERLKQADLLMVDQVRSTSLKDLVRQQVDPHVNITSHNARKLITFSVENVIVGVRNTWLNGDLNGLLCLFHALAFAALALVFLVNNDSHLAAFLARNLHLRVHAGTELSHLDRNSFSLAVGAWLGVRPAFPLAASAHPKSGHLHLLHLPAENLIQSHIDLDQLGLGLLRALIVVEEDVGEVAAVLRRASVLDSLLSVLVVQLSFFRVEERIICFLEELELLGVSALVGVLLEGTLAEGLLDLLSGCILRDLEQIVVLGGVHLLGSLLPLPLPLLPLLLLVLPLVLLALRVASEKHTTIRINQIYQESRALNLAQIYRE